MCEPERGEAGDTAWVPPLTEHSAVRADVAGEGSLRGRASQMPESRSAARLRPPLPFLQQRSRLSWAPAFVLLSIFGVIPRHCYEWLAGPRF